MSLCSSGGPAELRARSAAFTLIELLIVVGIIGALISILLPMTSRVREQARRTQCANHLRQLAAAEFMYANENRGWFSPCFLVAGSKTYWPIAWSFAFWEDFGPRYGLTTGKWVEQDSNGTTYTYREALTMDCPSGSRVWRVHDLNPTWGPVYYSAYFYIGNPTEKPGTIGSWWKDFDAAPRRVSDKRGAERVLAGDAVQGGSSAEGLGPDTFITNHMPTAYTNRRNTLKGANQLFADGHVAWKDGSDFPNPFNSAPGPNRNCNFVHGEANNYSLYW